MKGKVKRNINKIRFWTVLFSMELISKLLEDLMAGAHDQIIIINNSMECGTDTLEKLRKLV